MKATLVIIGMCVFVIVGYVLYTDHTVGTTVKNSVSKTDVLEINTDDVSAETLREVPSPVDTLSSLSDGVVAPRPYVELVDPEAYLHTDGQPFTLGEYIGKKIILVSFMTYSCINCQRTFPHLVSLDTKYRDEGLLVVGIHTPEFAFEHDAARVARELATYGITFPVILDNDYSTWRAYENRFWPRRYLIDGDGNVVYDHIGEGDYQGIENVIKALLPTIPAV